MRTVAERRFAMMLAGAIALGASGCGGEGESGPVPVERVGTPGPGACFCTDPWSGATRCCISSPTVAECRATVTQCSPWFISNTECAEVHGYTPCATKARAETAVQDEGAHPARARWARVLRGRDG